MAFGGNVQVLLNAPAREAYPESGTNTTGPLVLAWVMAPLTGSRVNETWLAPGSGLLTVQVQIG